jgi:hypothetical protein
MEEEESNRQSQTLSCREEKKPVALRNFEAFPFQLSTTSDRLFVQ